MFSLAIVLSLVFVVGAFGVTVTGATTSEIDRVFTGFGVALAILVIFVFIILLVDFLLWQRKGAR